VSELRRIIGEAVGEASLQWEPKPTGVFDSDGAVGVIDRTVHAIDQRIQELEAQAVAMREALEHCKHRPHAHNPLPAFTVTRCEVIDRALTTDAGKAMLAKVQQYETDARAWMERAARAAESMRERAAKVAERELERSHREKGVGLSGAPRRIAAAIHALPLEET
jgi:hypothetical protein